MHIKKSFQFDNNLLVLIIYMKMQTEQLENLKIILLYIIKTLLITSY